MDIHKYSIFNFQSSIPTRFRVGCTEVENNLDHIHQQALKELDAVENTDDLQDISVRYLGRKGILTRFLRNISKLPVEQRPAAGKKANEIKILLEKAFREATEKLEPQDEAKDAAIDVSLPGRAVACGALHPITQINQQICDIFSKIWGLISPKDRRWSRIITISRH